MAVVGPAVEVVLVSGCEALEAWAAPAAAHLMTWEQERMARFVKRDDRARYAAAHLLVRWALARSLCEPGLVLTLDQTERDKPFVVGPAAAAEISFSLSHTRGLVGCALWRTAPVGLDLEAAPRRLEVVELLDTVLSSAEREQWDRAALAEGPALERFLEIWTLKEALSKSLGVGLSVAPEEWSFDLETSPIQRLFALPDEFGDPAHWQFEQTRSPEGHVVSLAIPNPSSDSVPVEWTQLEAHELLAAMP